VSIKVGQMIKEVATALKKKENLKNRPMSWFFVFLPHSENRNI